MTRQMLCLQHDRGDGPALISAWAEANTVAIDLRMPDEALPDSAAAYELIVILGGRAGAKDDDEGLRAERRFARIASESGVPVLGLCLGAQMLAVEFGGDVIPKGAPEHGWTAIDILEPSLGGVFAKAPPEVFAWHNDAIVKPPAAALLATSAPGTVQAFRIEARAPIVALQFHLEADAEKIALFRRAGKREGVTTDDEAVAIEAQRAALFSLLDRLTNASNAAAEM